MRCIAKIEDTFLVTGRGLIVVPGPQKSEVEGPASFDVELRRPDGTVVSARANLSHILQTPPPPPHIASQWGCILSGVTKEDAPVGTEIMVGSTSGVRFK